MLHLCLQIPVPSIAPSSSRWSWDPEEERRRQEKWQKEQERLLQVTPPPPLSNSFAGLIQAMLLKGFIDFLVRGRCRTAEGFFF